MQGDGLHNLLARADSGDPKADTQVYSELLRLVRLFVRTSMGARLRDHRDSGDVCQSIARSFVQDYRDRAINFRSEGELVAYLKTVVRSKLAMLARADGTLKRGGDIATHAMPDGDIHADLSAGHRAVVSVEAAAQAREEIESVRSRLSDEDHEVARLRLAGLGWDQIAQRIGQEPQVLRKRWSRLVAKLADGGA